MWVYIIKTKDEALTCFKKFEAVVEKELGREIKVLRTDRGGEFCLSEFKIFCKEKGITRHFTAPYSPNIMGFWNVVTER